MKAIKTITKNIENQLKLTSSDTDLFISHAKEYIKAIKEGRVICSIEYVSKSGMNRFLNFKYMEKSKYKRNEYFLLDTYFLFKSLGYSHSKRHEAFKVSGCGMDMVFYTNYCIIHKLKNLGFLSDKECKILAQKTPSII